MGGSPDWSSTIAAPTAQSPADSAGQGSSRCSRLRFTRRTNAQLSSEVEWKLRRGLKSWRWTFLLFCAFVSAMDDGRTELITLLCTRIGMIMEDASVIALTMVDYKDAERTAALQQLATASAQIRALVQAALAIQE